MARDARAPSLPIGTKSFRQEKMKRKRLLLCFLFFLIGIVPLIKFSSPSWSISKRENILRIYLVGDIMLDRGVESRIKKDGKGDWRWPFLNIAHDLQKPIFYLEIWSAQFQIKEKK